uniref:Uncharacterized protein n=1 Tax=Setaria italica TaxID=4555 RepID=K3ZP11_SETIT
IKIEPNSCGLVVHDNKISGTTLYHASLSTGPCAAFLKPLDEAIAVYEILRNCDHPSLLKPLGVWKSTTDETKAYLVVEEVCGALISKGKQYMFSMEGSSIYGFSTNGFESFRAIFSVVDYVNNLYRKDVGSSTSEEAFPMLPLKINSSSVFYKKRSSSETHEEVQVLVGDFLPKYPARLVKIKRIQGPTVEHVRQFNWNKTGEYLSSFCGNKADVNLELNVLAELLKSENASYEDVMWQPGMWEAIVKMEFIREIYWIMDRQRDRKKECSFVRTEKGQVLYKIKSSLNVLSCVQQFTDWELKETNLLDSVVLLRDHVSEMGPDKVTLERFLQKSNPDYMIKLSKEVRSLNWITESSALRDENNYMAMFCEMERVEKSRQS